MRPTVQLMNRWQGSRFDWGICDCVLAVADWVLARTGVDPAADLRLTYRGAGECQRVTGFFTDPLSVIGPRMDRIAPRTDAPGPGDVGLVLVAVDGVVQPHGAVCLGGGLWGLKVEAGAMTTKRAKVLAAWSIGE